MPIGSIISGTGTERCVTELNAVTNIPVYLNSTSVPRLNTIAIISGSFFCFSDFPIQSAQR